MKRYLALIVLACCLSACGSETGADDKQQGSIEEGTTTTTTTTVTTTTTAVESRPESKPEETTTTTAAVESEPEKATTTTTTTTTTASAEDEPAATYTLNTVWHQQETLHSIIDVDTHVYAAPARDAEQIGDLNAGDVVLNIGYSEVPDWVVVEWNGGIGFVSGFDINGSVEANDANSTEAPYVEEPFGDTATMTEEAVDDDVFLLA
ncbi:SH3 domain-containing protein [Ruminococcus albus]|uniref:Conserved domain protein n=1 Tax=Ruminococcus albus 8 TaxID=246199 RepID=E9SCJ7_RUMAL|nr:SH3 domain-containing protein [Ruminococcus albus]EGC03032.1 conserved domain protein [Ruminococcus albus 8]MCC3352352.1 SH3 domain-containing protein [Ruminococcus albus 8]